MLLKEIVKSSAMVLGFCIFLRQRTDENRDEEVENDAPTCTVQRKRVASDANESTQFGDIGEGDGCEAGCQSPGHAFTREKAYIADA